MMFDKAVQEAKSEALRFITKANAYLERSRHDVYAKMGCTESAAVKRSSMDLTRALVKVRHPHGV